MKTKFLFSVLILCIIFNAQAQSKFERSLNEVIQAINQSTGKLQEVTVQTIEVNSISKARFGGGHTRQLVPINLPPGTQKWYYRVTVMPVNSNYKYLANETFYYTLANHLSKEAYSPTNGGIDFFLLSSSGDATSFSETGNNNFRYLDGYQRLKSNSFIGEGTNSEIGHPNLYIGIRNDNMTEGLKAIVEVVAWGHFQ